MTRKNKRNKGVSLADLEANRVRAQVNWLGRLMRGEPEEIQELKRIVDDMNAPPPPALEWTST